jgi:ubiquinone/menaquinone biosynthesis C-methylase UbiE
VSLQERWQLGGTAAEVYDRYLVPALFSAWATLVVEQAALQAGERVLDVACGTGVVTRLAASRVGAGGQVTGVDLNPGMLMVARALEPPAGGPIEWHEGDAAALPFPAAAFSAILCQLGLQYFPDRPRALREMHRVARPGGRIVLLVWRAITHSPGFEAMAAALERHVSAVAAATMRAPFVFGDGIEALRMLLTEAGFREVRIGSDVRMVRFASPDAFVQQQVAGSPLASHVAQVDDAARAAVRLDVSAAMQPYVNDDGLAFPIEAHLAIARA